MNLLKNISKFLDSFVYERAPDHHRENPQDRAARITANATRILAYFTVVLAVVGASQWWELRQQLAAMRADQRPYVWPTDDLGQPRFVGDPNNGQVIWSWKFTNYGKNAAVDIRYRQFIKVGDGNYKKSYGSPDTDFGGEMPPTKVNFATAISAPGYKSDDVSRYLQIDNAVGLLVDMEYFDGYGNRYTDAFCLEQLRTGAIALPDPKDCEKQRLADRATMLPLSWQAGAVAVAATSTASRVAVNPLPVAVVQLPPAPVPPRDYSGWVIAFVTFALAVATVFLARFTSRLWHSTSDLVSGSNATAQRELRAYVTVFKWKLFDFNENCKPMVEIHVRNFGRTPAYKFSVSAQVGFGLSTEMPVTQDDNLVLGHLAPGAEHTARAKAGFVLNRSQWQQVCSSAATVYVLGIIRYVDAFSTPHFTRFRLRVNPEDATLVSCGDGNDTDDDTRPEFNKIAPLPEPL